MCLNGDFVSPRKKDEKNKLIIFNLLCLQECKIIDDMDGGYDANCEVRRINRYGEKTRTGY